MLKVKTGFLRIFFSRLRKHKQKENIFYLHLSTIWPVDANTPRRITVKNNRSVGLVLLDLEKAFDFVWDDGSRYPNWKFLFAFWTWKIPSYKTANLYIFIYRYSSTDIPLPKDCHLAIFIDDTVLFCDIHWKQRLKRFQIFSLTRFCSSLTQQKTRSRTGETVLQLFLCQFSKIYSRRRLYCIQSFFQIVINVMFWSQAKKEYVWNHFIT